MADEKVFQVFLNSSDKELKLSIRAASFDQMAAQFWFKDTSNNVIAKVMVASTMAIVDSAFLE